MNKVFGVCHECGQVDCYCDEDLGSHGFIKREEIYNEQR